MSIYLIIVQFLPPILIRTKKRNSRNFVLDALVYFYLHDKVDLGGEEALGKAAFLSQILNSQFVAENLFSRLFDFKIDELVEDMNRIDYVQDELIGGDLGVKEMKLFDKLSNWRNYASLKREYM